MKKILLIAVSIFLLFGVAVKASDLIIDAKTQSYSEKENKIKLDGDVEVRLNDLKVISDKADVEVNKNNELDLVTFHDKPYAFEVKKNKKREVKANILKLSLIRKVIMAEGDTQTIVSDGKEPIVVITANSQEYDIKKNLMTAQGSVIIKYKDLETYSNKAVILTDGSGDLKKIDLYGNAKLREKEHNAEADHFSYDTVKEELIAIGNTTTNMQIEDSKNMKLKADYQQFDKKANIFLSSGKVRVWYEDYYAEGPKMSVYPEAKTKKFNEVYFSGRSSITQESKTIYADKIKLILKPKNFFAEGRTRTIIRNVQSSDVEMK